VGAEECDSTWFILCERRKKSRKLALVKCHSGKFERELLRAIFLQPLE
jgi:hypothetical protein